MTTQLTDTKAQHEKSNAEMLEEKFQLQNQINELKEECTALKAQLAAEQESLRNAKAMIEHRDKTLEDSKAENLQLQEQVTQTSKENHAQKMKIQQLENDILNLKGDLNNAADKHEFMNGEQNAANTEIVALKEKLSQSNELVEDLTQRLKVSERQCLDLQNELQAIRDKNKNEIQ